METTSCFSHSRFWSFKQHSLAKPYVSFSVSVQLKNKQVGKDPVLVLGVAHTPHLYSSNILQAFVPLWFCAWHGSELLQLILTHFVVLTESTQCLIHCWHTSLSLSPCIIAMDWWHVLWTYFPVSWKVPEGHYYPFSILPLCAQKPKYRVSIWLQIRLVTMAVK